MKRNHQQAEELATAFDGEAGVYEKAFELPASAKAMRHKTHQIFSSYLKENARVLDMNCGPGPDFSFFKQAGYRVTGIDLSPKMLALAHKRWPQARLECLDYNQINRLDQKYDAIISNFGGLNTQKDFQDFAFDCSQRLVNGGYFFVNIMTPFPLPELWEGIWNRSHFFRRLRHEGQPVRVGKGCIPVYYFWPKAFYKRVFSTYFKCLKVVGLGVFLPPPYMPLKNNALPRWSVGLENLLAHRFPFNNLGDHALIVMQLRDFGSEQMP